MRLLNACSMLQSFSLTSQRELLKIQSNLADFWMHLEHGELAASGAVGCFRVVRVDEICSVFTRYATATCWKMEILFWRSNLQSFQKYLPMNTQQIPYPEGSRKVLWKDFQKLSDALWPVLRMIFKSLSKAHRIILKSSRTHPLHTAQLQFHLSVDTRSTVHSSRSRQTAHCTRPAPTWRTSPAAKLLDRKIM